MIQLKKRLFFGAEIVAPWPNQYPQGRLIQEQFRHITLAFLGVVDFSKLEPLLSLIPLPSSLIGTVGKCDSLSFLPEKNPRVVAANVQWLQQEHQVDAYQKNLSTFLKEQGFRLDERPFFPHIAIARAPFVKEDWIKAIEPFPFYLKAIHLYESVGNLCYEKRWTHSFVLPFEEFEHTADIAFKIYGETVQEIHLNAQLALCFKYPPLLDFIDLNNQDCLDDIIIALNALISKADQEMGTPFKAVSFHGKLEKINGSFLKWEMVVDV